MLNSSPTPCGAVPASSGGGGGEKGGVVGNRGDAFRNQKRNGDGTVTVLVALYPYDRHPGRKSDPPTKGVRVFHPVNKIQSLEHEAGCTTSPGENLLRHGHFLLKVYRV